MTTENFRSVEARAVEMSKIAQDARDTAYREGFAAGAEATRENIAARSVDFDDDSRRFGALVRLLPLPTPTEPKS